MHISDGVLSVPVLTAGWIGCAGLMAVGLRKTDNETIPRVSMMAAVFFLGSLVHIPLGPTSAHLLLSGLIVLFIGWSAAPAVFLALLLQALIFGFGGISVLGPNTFQIVAPALLVGLPLRKIVTAPGKKGLAAAFAVGLLSVLGTSGLLFANLYLSNPYMAGAAYLGFIGNCVVAAIEGPVTLFAVSWVRQNAPLSLSGCSKNTLLRKAARDGKTTA